MIKNWKKFIESVSGLPGADTAPIGPNFGEQKLAKTLSDDQSSLIEGSDGIFYDMDGYIKLYNKTLTKMTLDPNLRNNFNRSNLEKLLQMGCSED